MLPFHLPPPVGYDTAPVWTGRGFKLASSVIPLLEYSENFAGWSDDLTTLHEEAAGDAHPIDLASRADAVRQLQKQLAGRAAPVILEIGCSSGFMLRDISQALPHAVVVGADVVKAPLYKLAEQMPQTPLLRFDLLQCPLPAASFDAIVLLNVLEHIEDDVRALQQVFRLLKPGGVAIIEVPAGPQLYDAYDKALMHFRRYGMAELVEKLDGTGFGVRRKSHLGCLVYPAFAHVKRRNQKSPTSNTQALQGVVKQQAHSTGSSLLMKVVMAVEMAMGKYVSYPVGVRCLVTVGKTIDDEK
jgi:SAM-dependent methyltransferase